MTPALIWVRLPDDENHHVLWGQSSAVAMAMDGYYLFLGGNRGSVISEDITPHIMP